MVSQLADHKGDDWEEMARIYKKLTVGTSAKPIGVILEGLNAAWPFSKAVGIHDDGCGPGGVISRLIEDYGNEIPESCPLTCSDFSAPMIEQVVQTKAERVQADPKSPWNRVQASVLNAMDLNTVEDDSKSHVTAGWVFFMTPDPQKCLSESKRVLKDGGVLGLSSWKDSQWMDLMRLVKEIRPDKKLPEIPEAWSDSTLLGAEMDRAGFRNVEVKEVDVKMTFDHYEPLIDLLTTKMPHMVALLKDFTEGQMAELRALMLERIKEISSTVPGEMHGVALVAVGQK